jgi:hypothetical protein
MGIVKFAGALLIAAVMVGVGASSFWAGHVSSGSPSLEVNAYQPGWVNQPWLGETMPTSAALSLVGDSVGVVYYLDPDSGSWQRYVPGRPEVSNLDTMVFGRAYLMLFTKPVTATLSTEPEDICPATPDSECPGQVIDQGQLDEVCDLINELAQESDDLQMAWSDLLWKIEASAVDDPFLQGSWTATDWAVHDLDEVVSSLELWCLVHTPARPAAQ